MYQGYGQLRNSDQEILNIQDKCWTNNTNFIQVINDQMEAKMAVYKSRKRNAVYIMKLVFSTEGDVSYFKDLNFR